MKNTVSPSSVRPMLPMSRLVPGHSRTIGPDEVPAPIFDGVMTMINAIENTIERVHDVICMLAERLSPIINDRKTDGNAGSATPECYTGKSPVYLALERINERLNAIESHQRDLVNRVDV